MAQWQRICLPMPEMQETQVPSLDWKDHLQEEKANHGYSPWCIPCVCVPVLRVRLGPAVLMGCDFPFRAVQPRPQQVFGDDLPDRQDGEQPGPSRRKRQPSMSETMPLYTLCKEDLESMDKEVSPRCPLAAGAARWGETGQCAGSAGGSFLTPPGDHGAPPVGCGQLLRGDCRLSYSPGALCLWTCGSVWSSERCL